MGCDRAFVAGLRGKGASSGGRSPRGERDALQGEDGWRDLPERYGPWKTVYNRFWRWSRNGTLTMPVSKARVIAEAIDELDREVAATAAHTGGERVLRRTNRTR